MTGLRKFLISAAALGAIAGGGALLAQPDSSRPADELPELAAPAERLTPAQMRKAVVETLETLRAQLAGLVKLRQLARDSRDIIKLNCVNDKMLLFKQVVNIAEEAQTDMAEAIAEGDESARTHSYNRVRLARERADKLRHGAERCIGAELAFIGPTQLEVDTPPVDELDAYDWFELDDPKYATPFR